MTDTDEIPAPEPITFTNEQLHAWAVRARKGELPDGVTVAQISAVVLEAWSWRINTAATLETALALEASAEKAGNLDEAARIRVGTIMPQSAALRDTLAGNYAVGSCEACGLAVWPGDLVVYYNDVGEMHVNCQEPDRSKHYAEGHRFPLDPDELDLDEGEEPPADPHLIVYRSEEDYTPAKLDAVYARARAEQDHGAAEDRADD